jgi:HNH endonuclease
MTKQGGHCMPTRVARITLICTYQPCQAPFEALPHRIGRAKYCSKRCRDLAANQRLTPLADRFWAKVLTAGPDECWLWQGGKTGAGYGVLRVAEQDRNVGAHVVSWYLHTGRWPAAGNEIMHHCPTGDTKACVNPAHLGEGTHLENMREMFAKGGPTKTWMKVSEVQAEEMRTLYATGQWTLAQLGTRYGITFHGVSYHIRRHKQSSNDEISYIQESP